MADASAKLRLAERYNALSPNQQRVAGALYIACTEQQAKRARELCWAEAIEAAELVRAV